MSYRVIVNVKHEALVEYSYYELMCTNWIKVLVIREEYLNI